MRNSALVTATFAISTLSLFGCTTTIEAPQGSASSMAIIEPYVLGKMRVGLNFQSYVYNDKPGMIQINQGLNRLICPDAINQTNGRKYKPKSFIGATQCYYPNLDAGKYVLDDYPLDRDNEKYRVLLVTLYNTVTFDSKKIQFSIRSGEVKHVGKYLVHINDSGQKAKVIKIETLASAPAIKQASLELTRAKSTWKFP